MKFFWAVLFFSFCVNVPAQESSALAEKLVAERMDEACIEELKDLIMRREAFLSAAETLSENERSRQAADIAERFESHLKRFPDSFPGLYYFADFLYRGGENARAESLLLRAEKLAPDLAPIHILIAKIFAEKGEVEKALSRFRIGISSGKPDAETFAFYGEFLIDNRKRLLEAESFGSRAEFDENMQNAFRLAAILSGKNPDFYWRYAESFYDVENPDWEAALFAWENVARVPSVKERGDLTAAVSLHRARALAELSRIDEADTILRQTVAFPALERSRRRVFEIIRQKRRSAD